MNFISAGFIAVVSLAVAFKAGEHRGYLQAEARVLKVNPPSHELEMACLGLWVGEQNKKYSEKNRGP